MCVYEYSRHSVNKVLITSVKFCIQSTCIVFLSSLTEIFDKQGCCPQTKKKCVVVFAKKQRPTHVNHFCFTLAVLIFQGRKRDMEI